METNNFPSKFLLLFILLSVIPFTHCSTPTTCNTTFSINNTEAFLLLKAFSSVSGFSPSLLLLLHHFNSSSSGCPPPPITQLLLPSKNLSGTISWKYFKNLTQLRTIDLSNNSLQGNVPIWFWSLSPNLRKLNISNNHFGGSIGFKHPTNSSSSSYPSGIQILDASKNRFTKLIGVSGFTNLSYLDVSGNGLRKIPRGGFSGLGGTLEVLNMKGCNVTGGLNGGGGIKGLDGLKYLDLSGNELEGEFPTDFPSLDGLSFLNVSLNRFSGDVVTVNKYRAIFGKSAFIKAGNFSTATATTNGTHSYHTASSPSSNPTTPSPPTTHHIHHHHHQNNSTSASHTTSQKQSGRHKINKRKKKKKKLIKLISIGTSAFLFSSLLFLALLCYFRNRTLRRQKTKWAISKPLNQHSFPFPSTSDVLISPSSSKPTTQQNKSVVLHGPFSFETESGSSWVADIKEPTSAPVTMFEKPLINYITFKDLIIGTCHFGKESQLGGEGKCGPVYRGVLPGELHVAVKVLEYLDGFRRLEKREAVLVFEELALFRHPNLLPISGYCIAGKEKLILSEYMPNGDLHSWLHELPPGKPNVDDWTTDTWEEEEDYHHHTNPTVTPGSSSTLYVVPTTTWSEEKLSFHTRHRMAVGIARGLAYLHHARSKPLVHGHLVPSNILLTDDLEPRISDFGLSVYGGRSGVGPAAATEDDVYCFGLILIELFTGKPVDEDGVVGRVRRLVKNGNVDQVIDPRLRMMGGGGWVSQMVECLRVGYLCTAEVPGKRPTMQQAVGLLKDVSTASTQSQHG